MATTPRCVDFASVSMLAMGVVAFLLRKCWRPWALTSQVPALLHTIALHCPNAHHILAVAWTFAHGDA